MQSCSISCNTLATIDVLETEIDIDIERRCYGKILPLMASLPLRLVVVDAVGVGESFEYGVVDLVAAVVFVFVVVDAVVVAIDSVVVAIDSVVVAIVVDGSVAVNHKSKTQRSYKSVPLIVASACTFIVNTDLSASWENFDAELGRIRNRPLYRLRHMKRRTSSNGSGSQKYFREYPGNDSPSYSYSMTLYNEGLKRLKVFCFAES